MLRNSQVCHLGSFLHHLSQQLSNCSSFQAASLMGLAAGIGLRSGKRPWWVSFFNWKNFIECLPCTRPWVNGEGLRREGMNSVCDMRFSFLDSFRSRDQLCELAWKKALSALHQPRELGPPRSGSRGSWTDAGCGQSTYFASLVQLRICEF